MFRERIVTYALPLLLAALVTDHARALEAENLPDSTFGSNGSLVFGVASVDGRHQDVGWIVLPRTGGYWLVGSSAPPGTVLAEVMLAQLDADGVLVPGFGNGGVLATGEPGIPVGAFVDSQERLLVGVQNGSALSDAVARFLPSGLLDSSYGGGGLWETPGTGADNLQIWDIAPASNDRVWVVQQQFAGLRNSELVRLSASGAPDGGLEEVGTAARPADPSALFTDSQGRTWWATRAFVGLDEHMLLVRLTAAGTLDNTFADFGVASTGAGCASGAEVIISRMDLALLPGDGALMLFRYGSFAPDGAIGMRFVRADGSAGSLRCDADGSAVATTSAVVARDAASFLGAAVACVAGGGCGPTLRRFVVGYDGGIDEDPQWDPQAAARLVGGATPADGIGLGLTVLDNAPLVAGAVQTSQGDFDAIVSRYGVLSSIFRSGFE